MNCAESDSHQVIDDPVHKIAEKLNWPYELAKATVDQFFYEIRLRDGTVIEFEEATVLNPEWIRIDGITSMFQNQRDCKKCYDRGLAIRISDIVSIADAPNGS